MQNVGEVTRPPTPSAAASPWTNVVFPAPRSPSRQTTSPGFSSFANSPAKAHVSSTDPVSNKPFIGKLPEAHP